MTDKNLLFVCVDCLRSDFVGTEHADTPFIDNLAATGTDYRDMYASATTTTPSVTSFMTGTYSEHNGVYSLEKARLNDSVPTLAEHLSTAGYDTTAMVTGPIIADTGLNRGFDEYMYRDYSEELVGNWFDEAVATLDSLEEPFFCYLHLWEIHNPVRVPDGFDDPEYGRYPYARTLSALDRALGRLCDHLPSNTGIALHGDHGEAIGYHDSYLHKILKFLRTGLRYGLGVDTREIERRLKDQFNRDLSIPDHFMEDGHGENVFDFVSNVPFLLSGPDIDTATVNTQVRQIDIFPTLLDYLDVDLGQDRSIDGESLLPPDSVGDRDAYIRACGKSLLREANWQRAIRAANHKYVDYENRDWNYELYDLAADPNELDPIKDDRIATRLKQRMPEKKIRDDALLEIDDLLQDLGYK